MGHLVERTGTRLVAVVACCTLVLAACGDDDSDGSSASSTSTTELTDDSATSSTTSTSVSEGDDADAGAPAAMAEFAGTWSGTWTNETYGSTGPIEFTVELDEAAGTATFTLDLGGLVFGEGDPEPESFVIPLAGPSEAIQTSTFGPIVMSTDATFTTFTGVAGAVPSDAIQSLEFTGTLTEPGTMSGTYEVTFPDANTATGTFTFTRA